MSSNEEVKLPGFGSVLMAFVIPPFYFFSRGRIVAGIINGIILAISFPLIMFGVGFVGWLICAIWAIVCINNERTAAHAKMTGMQTAAAVEEMHKKALGEAMAQLRKDQVEVVAPPAKVLEGDCLREV